MAKLSGLNMFSIVLQKKMKMEVDDDEDDDDEEDDDEWVSCWIYC